MCDLMRGFRYFLCLILLWNAGVLVGYLLLFDEAA